MKVILLIAATADGMIARHPAQLVDWTGKADKKYFVHITKKAGVVIMGSKTFDTIGKVLPHRKNIVMTRDKIRTSPDYNKAFYNQDDNLIFTSQTPKKIVKNLIDQGFKSAILIGGSEVSTLFIKENLINEVHLTIVPRFFGKGLTLFKESLDTRLELLDVQKLNADHVLLKYRA